MDNHLTVDVSEMCKATPETNPIARANPEDGITPEIDDVLAKRSTKDKIDTWETLWKCLFPEKVLTCIPPHGQ